MKFLIIILGCFFTVQAGAKVSNPIFSCNSEVEIDATTKEKLGISIVTRGADYIAYLTGATQPGPLPALRQVLPYKAALKTNGVQDILKATKLSSADITKITSVVVYTQGNFDDDLAGVRAAEFLNSSADVLAKGMYFGWAGPFSCQ